MREKNFFHIFGLNVESDIAFSGFVGKKCNSDIKIYLGDVPDKLDQEHIDKGINFKFSNNNEFWLYIEDVAHYYISNGEEIYVEALNNADINTIKSYLFSVVFGIALLQRKLTAMHGSSIVFNNKCLIFTGSSGAGKSTICSSLVKRGYQFLADDISVISFDKNKVPVVQPSYPYQRLCHDAVMSIKPYTGKQKVVFEGDGKSLLYMPDSFYRKPLPLAAIIELAPEADCDIGMKELTGTEKLKSFIENIFCFAFLQQAGVNPKLFADAYHIVKNIPYYKLQRPIGKFTIDQQIDRVMEIVRE